MTLVMSVSQHQQKNWWFWTVVLEETLESPLDWKEIQPVHPKGNQPWIFIGRTDAEAETPILWLSDVKNWLIAKFWCWERLRVGGEGDDKGWDGWMASLTQWTWVCVSFRSWWWTGRPAVLQCMGLQRVEHNWATKLKLTCQLPLKTAVPLRLPWPQAPAFLRAHSTPTERHSAVTSDPGSCSVPASGQAALAPSPPSLLGVLRLQAVI